MCGWQAALHAYTIDKMPGVSLVPASSFLLVATDQMSDPRFRKTVVLVTRHGSTGHMGVIVNRQQGITLDKIFPAYSEAKAFSLFTGGPVVPKQISYLVRGSDAVPDALRISGDIYLAYHVQMLGELFSGKRHHTGLRVLHGLSTWAPRQLEKEIELGAWFVMPLDDAVIFDRPAEEIWTEMHRRAGSLLK